MGSIGDSQPDDFFPKVLGQIDDDVAHFHEIVKPGHPQYKNLLKQWKEGTKLKKEVRS